MIIDNFNFINNKSFKSKNIKNKTIKSKYIKNKPKNIKYFLNFNKSKSVNKYKKNKSFKKFKKGGSAWQYTQRVYGAMGEQKPLNDNTNVIATNKLI